MFQNKKDVVRGLNCKLSKLFNILVYLLINTYWYLLKIDRSLKYQIALLYLISAPPIDVIGYYETGDGVHMAVTSELCSELVSSLNLISIDVAVYCISIYPP